MSDSEDPQHCHVCSVFEPQAWRKSLCRNCFHSLEEHSEELLAQEAEAVASESGSKQPADDRGSHAESTKPKDKTVAGKTSTTGAASEKDSKTKFSSSKDETKTAAASKDVAAAREMAKPGPSKASSTVAMMSGKSKTSAGATSSTAVSSSPSKSPPKTTSSSSSSSASSSTTTTSTTTSTSPPSSLSATPTTASTAAQKTTVSLAKNFASKFESKTGAPSKDKQPLSKFLDARGGGGSVSVTTGKLSTDKKGESKSASPPKSQDTKQTDSTKTSDSKLTVSPKTTPQKTDTKTVKKEEAAMSEVSTSEVSTSEVSTSEVSTSNKSTSNKLPSDTKSNSSLIKEETSKTLDDKSKGSFSQDWKEKKTLTQLNKSDEKDSKSSLTSRSKTAAPFGKDMLKSKKEAVKKESSPVKEVLDTKSKDNGGNKAKPPSPKSLPTPTNDRDKASPLSKVAAGKLFDDKTKKNGDNSTIKARQSDTVGGQPVGNAQEPKLSPLASRSTQGPEQSESTTGVNKSGQQAKLATGKTTNDSKASEPASGTDRQSDDVRDSSQNNKKDISLKTSPTKSERDKSSPYRDRGKDESSAISKKSDVLSPTSEKLPSTPTSKLSTSSSSKSPSKSSTDKVKDSSKDTKPGVAGKLKEVDKAQEKLTTSTKTEKQNGPSDCSSKKGNDRPSEGVDSDVAKKLTEELKEKAEALSTLTKQLATMEEKMKALEQEKEKVRKDSAQSVKDDLEKLMKELRSQICDLESHCSKLEKDNRDLIEKLREMDSKNSTGKDKKTVDNSVLEEDLEAAEKELEEVKEENKELQRLIMEMRNEMDEMYDHFRESEHDEFRELQKELDMTAKNCRILQFKLRKAERRNDQIEEDRIHYEEKLRKLQDKFDSQDAKNHIRLLEEELRMAKEVSVRLHDELDIIEDKKNKALEESRHLTELLEHTDKRQFRMEMEIDKLRDLVSDLRQQLKEAKGGNNKDSSSPDRKPPLGAIGKQGSKEYDVSQLMKDLCDSMERENDMRDQLKFTEEESKMLRKRVSSMDEENEYLRLQLQKMSEKASKHKKKEKETQRELEVEKKHSESIKAALLNAHEEGSGGLSDDVILIVGGDVIEGDEPIPISQRKDSTDEDLMNVMQLRVQLEMVEQELMTSHKKLDDMDLENENLQAEVKFLQERLSEKETASAVTLVEPSTPNAYYEDKLRELSQETDELRWKLIEKDREIERLSIVQTRHLREHSHKKDEKLKKSKSLDTDTELATADLRKQVDSLQIEVIRLRQKLEEAEEKMEELRVENEDLKNRTPIPSVKADDAPLENIELKDRVRILLEENKLQADKIKMLTENLQKLSRDTRSYTSIATSPTTPDYVCNASPVLLDVLSSWKSIWLLDDVIWTAG